MHKLKHASVDRLLEHGKKPKFHLDKFDLQDDDPYSASNYYENGYATLVAQEYQSCPSKVMSLYFSDDNIKRIQKMIKREVYRRSRGKYILTEDQDASDLNLAMRAVFKLYAKNLPTGIVRQVKGLNDQTVQYVVPDMMTNIEQYYGYLKDILNPINPIQLPTNVNTGGRKIIPGVAWALEL